MGDLPSKSTKKNAMSSVISQTDTKKTNSSTSKSDKVDIKIDSKYSVIQGNDIVDINDNTNNQYSLFIDFASAQGKREYMEDYHLIVMDKEENTLLAIVCDGHGSYKLAEQLIRLIPNRLFPILAAAQMDSLR
jgi:hypothetical protein